MNYIILDMEWNQPFYPTYKINNSFCLRGEIIQIGAVKLDENFKVVDNFKGLIAPVYYTVMHKKVAKLTGITTEDLQYGLPFRTILKHFKKWCGEEYVFLTWGDDDIQILRDNIALHQRWDEWIPKSYNLQVIFDRQISKEGKFMSLSKAMQIVEEPELEAHDALHDARNAARICAHLDLGKGFAEYDAWLKHMNSTPPMVREQSVKTYDKRKEGLADPELTDFACPLCGLSVTYGEIVKHNADKYMSIGRCSGGDKLFARYKFKRWSDGKFTTTRTVCELDQEHVEFFLQKKE